MPNYYAHLTFGQRVLADLPAGLSELIEQEREAFDLGCLGPDPLFFYQPIRPNAVRREGIKMHRRSALPAVERLRQAIEDGVPMSTGYGAGFLCHLALDSACHGYVDDRAADGPISHMAIEGEYDRMLMERDGLNAAEQSPLPSAPADRAVWEAASQALSTPPPTRCGGLPLHGLLLRLPGPLQRPHDRQGHRCSEPHAPHSLRQGHRPEGDAPPLGSGEQRRPQPSAGGGHP